MMKKSSFFILLNICMVVYNEVKVEQDPVITVTKGDKAHLRCRFSTTGNSKVGTFTWYRNAPAPKGKEVNNETHPTGIIKVEKSFRDNDASIYILETLMQYAGTYYCEVDLVVKKATGNGTQLVVKMPENKPNSDVCEEEEEDKRTWTVIRIILFTLLAFLSVPVTYFVHRKKK